MEIKEYHIPTILENGAIELLVKTIYIEPSDGKEIPIKNWRVCLMPGEFEKAEKLLDEYSMNIVRAAWTPEVVELYQLKLLEDAKKANANSLN